MGFRKDAYATVWSVESISDVNTKLRISISRKDKQTGEYVDEFSEFVNVYGTLSAKHAAALTKGDRIRLGDVDVKSKYVKEKNTTYYNFNIFSFDILDRTNNVSAENTVEAMTQNVDNGEVDDSRLPF